MSRTRRIFGKKNISGTGSYIVSRKEESRSMFLDFKKSAIAASVVVSILAASGVFAAGLTKVYVPRSICKEKRTFWKSDLPEVTLAKVTLGRSTNEVLARWGDPTTVTVGVKQTDGAATENPGGGPVYTPPAGAATDPYGAITAGVNAAADRLGRMNPPMGGAPYGGGLPPLPGMTTPGAGIPGLGDPTSAKNNLDEDEVCYTYKLKGKGAITLDFVINNGIVTQITASGTGPWPYSKTKTGLQLGDTYALTLWVCGTPEDQKNNGKYLQVSYAQRNRSVYTFLNKKLVGVTIALMPESE
ncbi:MAG: hypothetical protein NT018_04670 [Armatimonadetes bacterium]|nr:hypothetical protein [Armatimonadota bacterium]